MIFNFCRGDRSKIRPCRAGRPGIVHAMTFYQVDIFLYFGYYKKPGKSPLQANKNR
jgi:hypothetical protein